MTLQSLIDAGCRYVFHAGPAKYIGKIAESGLILAGAFVPGASSKPGTKKDMKGGGANFVYCRMVVENSPQLIGTFGTRSSLKGRVYYVMPIRKLENYNWFISSVDLNGKLPTGMLSTDTGQSEESKNGTIKGIVSTINKGTKTTANYEIGLHSAIQISDLSHVIVTGQTRTEYQKDLYNLVQSAGHMRQLLDYPDKPMPVSAYIKIRSSADGQTAWKAILGKM
jgi:hypothetical protein